MLDLITNQLIRNHKNFREMPEIINQQQNQQ